MTSNSLLHHACSLLLAAVSLWLSVASLLLLLVTVSWLSSRLPLLLSGLVVKSWCIWERTVGRLFITDAWKREWNFISKITHSQKNHRGTLNEVPHNHQFGDVALWVLRRMLLVSSSAQCQTPLNDLSWNSVKRYNSKLLVSVLQYSTALQEHSTYKFDLRMFHFTKFGKILSQGAWVNFKGMFLTVVYMDLCKCTGGKLCNIALGTFTTQPNDVPLLQYEDHPLVWKYLPLQTVQCKRKTNNWGTNLYCDMLLVPYLCLYHVQSRSNFTTDCKITMFTSRSNFQRRDSLVWERDCATSSLSSI